MDPKRASLLMVLLMLAGPLLAGCLAPEQPRSPDPANQEDPQISGSGNQTEEANRSLPGPWDRGRQFHYRGENGIWQNWTVLGIEEKHNYTTYKVQVNWSEPDSSGYTVYISWIDVNSLGEVAEDQREVYAWASQPWDQILPLREKGYTYTAHVEPLGYEENVDVRVTLGERRPFSVPGGTFDSQQLIYELGRRESRVAVNWYASDIGYYVSFVDRRGDFDWTRFNLTAWSP